jgi:hypothetical protein
MTPPLGSERGKDRAAGAEALAVKFDHAAVALLTRASRSTILFRLVRDDVLDATGNKQEPLSVASGLGTC